MRHRRSFVSVALATSAVALAALAGPASAVHEGIEVTGLTQNNRLVTFDADTPDVIESTVKITGIAGDIIGIDFRPANGLLYAVGNVDGVGTLYTVDTATGAATAVPGALTLALRGEDFGFDVNPAADRLRIISDLGQNLRVNPVTGVIGGGTVNGAGTAAIPFGSEDLPLNFAGAAGTPAAVGAAYTNNDNDAATGTTLFDIETLTDSLFTQAPPNAGTLAGPVGLGGVGKDVGFDIYSERQADGTTSNVALLTNRQGGTTTISVVRLPGNPAGAGLVAASTEAIATNPPVVDIAIDPAQ